VGINKVEHLFSGKKVSYYFDADFGYLEQVVSREHTILITDENVFAASPALFAGWKTIVIQAGEAYKQQASVDKIFEQLIASGSRPKNFYSWCGRWCSY
jgi:3-dehydroquinate synthase